MPVIYAVVLLVAVGIAVAAFFVAGRAVHTPDSDATTDDTDGRG